MQPEAERYELGDELGRGGTATVVKAYDRILERFVALKVLTGPIANDPEFMSRFEREARLAARLEHPNIVTIYDFGRFTDGRGFIAMRLLTGEGLDRLIARSAPMAPELAAGIIEQIASALDYTHSIGMVHRDVKPNNVIIDPAGRATLTDFGIARAFDSARMTMTGLSIGTPRYMAPEQISGEEVTGASDVYALGVVAFELLTGRGPFPGEGTALMFKIVHEEPPLVTAVNAALPVAVASVVARALAKDPAERWPSAGEFARALRESLRQEPTAPASTVIPSAGAAVREDPEATLVTPAPSHARPLTPVVPPAVSPPAAATVVAPARAPETPEPRPRAWPRIALFALAALLVTGGGIGVAYAAGLFDGDATGSDGDSDGSANGGASGVAGTAEEIDSLPPMVAIGAGETHTCGLTIEGQIGCRGNTADGRATAPAGYFSQLSVGKGHSCALRTDARVLCWGSNAAGQASAPNDSFVAVAAGGAHSCGILQDGSVTCWGSNSEGQTRAASGAFTSIALGQIHSCGIRSDQTVACWGSNAKGQATAPSGRFKSLAAGGSYTCGLAENGDATCWGETLSVAPKGAFIQLSAGAGFICGIRAQSGAIACWGIDTVGQTDPPRGEFSSVSAGWTHACAVRVDAKVLCWGSVK